MEKYLSEIKKYAPPAVRSYEVIDGEIIFKFRTLFSVDDVSMGVIGHNRKTGKIYINIPNVVEVNFLNDNSKLFEYLLFAQSYYDIDFGRFRFNIDAGNCFIEGQFDDKLPITGEILAWGMRCCIRLLLSLEFEIKRRKSILLMDNGFMNPDEYEIKYKELIDELYRLTNIGTKKELKSSKSSKSSKASKASKGADEL